MPQHVLVIGAGAAGLMAARTLHDKSIPVTVLEARERVGGRTWTNYDFAAHPVELGAEFIHGSQVITWDLLRKYGLKTLPPLAFENIYAMLDGKIKPFEQHIPTDWDEKIWDAAEDWLDDNKPEISLRELMDRHGWLTNHESDVARLVNNTFASDYGADLNKLGVSYVLSTFEGDATDDGDYHIVTGYSSLMGHLADGLDIRLNTPISHIKYSQNRVHVTAQDGTIFEGTQAIITLPLGILKAGDVRFEPALPQEKQTAIERIGAGKVNKLLMKFSEAFWDDRAEMMALYTSRDSQMWWRPGWKRDNESPILTAFAGGKAGAEQSAMSDDEAITRSLEDLAHVFQRDIRDLLVDAHFINWGADPFSKLGYSYDAVGSSGMRNALQATINNTLYFAGEACHPIRPQTVHGALETGLTAAHAIMA